MEVQEDIEIIEDEEPLETTDVGTPEEDVEPEEEVSEAEPSRRKRWLRSALLVLRDVGIALLVVLIVFLILWAYSGVWPPIVVVESSSMQHDDYSSSVGVIDTGDLVLVQNTNSPREIETFVHGQCSGHSTYGDEGDVIVYNELGGGDKPIIHRALVWLEFNTTSNNGFDVPHLECEKWESGVNWWAYNTNVSGSPTLMTEPRNLNYTLDIRVISAYRNITVKINLVEYLSDIKSDPNWTDGGFATLGDNNNQVDKHLIKHDWIIGKARGELPWFGLIKLTVTGDIPWGEVCSHQGDSNCAPENSWTSLVVVLIILIVVPIVLDISIGFYQRWRRKHPKKSEDEKEAAEEEHEEPSEELAEDATGEEVSEETSEDIEETL